MSHCSRRSHRQPSMCSISDCMAYSSLTTSSFVLRKKKGRNKKTRRSMFRASFSARSLFDDQLSERRRERKRERDEKRWFFSSSLIPPVFVIPSLFVWHSNPLASNGMRQSYHLAHVRFRGWQQAAAAAHLPLPSCWP